MDFLRVHGRVPFPHSCAETWTVLASDRLSTFTDLPLSRLSFYDTNSPTYDNISPNLWFTLDNYKLQNSISSHNYSVELETVHVSPEPVYVSRKYADIIWRTPMKITYVQQFLHQCMLVTPHGSYTIHGNKTKISSWAKMADIPPLLVRPSLEFHEFIRGQ